MPTCLVAGRIRYVSLLCIFFVLTFASLAIAQGVTGIISGTVTDPSKSPVAGATVTITNADTGVVAYSGNTNESGVYRAPDLPIGRYNVNVAAGDFKTQQVSGVPLSVDQSANISVTLQLGQVAETVTVQG